MNSENYFYLPAKGVEMIPAKAAKACSPTTVKIYAIVKDTTDKILLNQGKKGLNFLQGTFHENVYSSSNFAAAGIFLKKCNNSKEGINYFSDTYLRWVKHFTNAIVSRDESGNYKFLTEISPASLPASIKDNSKIQLATLDDLAHTQPELAKELNDFRDELDNAQFNRDKNNFAMFDCEPDPLWVEHYDYLYYGWLKNKGENWKTYKIYNDEFPSAEEISKLKGVLISGSDWNVYNTAIPQIAPFLEKLKKMIQDNPQLKIVGICFGSQALAQTLGGRVEKMKLDPALGPLIMNREKIRLMNGFADKYSKEVTYEEVHIAQVHGDHVAQAPEGAVIYGKSENTNVEIWGLNDNILAFQGHPEFNLSLMTDKIVPEVKDQYSHVHNIDQVCEGSMKSLKSGDLDQKLIFGWINNFLKN